MSDYARKNVVKNATVIDTSNFAKKTVNHSNLKPDEGKLDLDKLKNAPSNLSTFKSKVDKLDVDKLVPVPIDLSKLSDLVKMDVVKKDPYDANIKDIEDKTPDITNLATNTTLNAEINDVKNKTPSITNLATATVLTAVEKKIPDHSKYITTAEFNKLIANKLLQYQSKQI